MYNSFNFMGDYSTTGGNNDLRYYSPSNYTVTRPR